MDETTFHTLADALLTRFMDKVEEADAHGALEVDIEQGSLSIRLPDGKQLLISKHAPTLQLWLASPISGGLHFRYTNETWVLSDGRPLATILAQEIQQLASIRVVL